MVNELFKEYLNKKLRLTSHRKFGLLSPSEKHQIETENLQKINDLIVKVKKKDIISPLNNFTNVHNKTYINSHIGSNNNSVNTYNNLSLDRKRISTGKESKNKPTFRTHRTKESIAYETSSNCKLDQSLLFDDSFIVSTRAKSSKLAKTKIDRVDVLSVKEMTQIETIPIEDNFRDFARTLPKKPVKNLKMKIVNRKVKENLLEWKETKSSRKFHSGNFDLPLYTLSK